LTLLYHLARNGSTGNGWRGVSHILEKAGLKTIPDNRVLYRLCVSNETTEKAVID